MVALRKVDRLRWIDFEAAKHRFLANEVRVKNIENDYLLQQHRAAGIFSAGDTASIEARRYVEHQTLTDIRNANLWEMNGDTWRRHAVENRKAIRSSIDREWPRRLNRKCHIVCAAGPGLDEALPALRYIKQHNLAVIWAVDMSWKPLMVAGVKPDIVVSCDFHETTVQKMLTAHKSLAPPPCVFFPQSPPNAVRAWRGPRLFAIGIDFVRPLVDLVPEVTALRPYPTFGTVSGMAMIIARYMGGSETKLVGIAGNDLSYPFEAATGRMLQYCKNTIRATEPDGSSYVDTNAVIHGDHGGQVAQVEMRNDKGEHCGTRTVLHTVKMNAYVESFGMFFKQEDIISKNEGRRMPVHYMSITNGALDRYSVANKRYGSLDACERFITMPPQYFIDACKFWREQEQQEKEKGAHA